MKRPTETDGNKPPKKPRLARQDTPVQHQDTKVQRQVAAAIKQICPTWTIPPPGQDSSLRGHWEWLFDLAFIPDPWPAAASMLISQMTGQTDCVATYYRKNHRKAIWRVRWSKVHSNLPAPQLHAHALVYTCALIANQEALANLEAVLQDAIEDSWEDEPPAYIKPALVRLRNEKATLHQVEMTWLRHEMSLKHIWLTKTALCQVLPVELSQIVARYHIWLQVLYFQKIAICMQPNLAQ